MRASERSPGRIIVVVKVGARFDKSGVLDKEKQIIVYCNGGGRSYNAYRKLMKLGYKDIRQTLFFDWQEAGLPVEKGDA
jgi:rhodanese-related sulfurtransferase